LQAVAANSRKLRELYLDLKRLNCVQHAGGGTLDSAWAEAYPLIGREKSPQFGHFVGRGKKLPGEPRFFLGGRIADSQGPGDNRQVNPPY